MIHTRTVPALLALVVGCSNDDRPCGPGADFNELSPVVSFRADVLPIFQTKCSSGCHGDPTVLDGGVADDLGELYLGCPSTIAGCGSAADRATIIAGLQQPTHAWTVGGTTVDDVQMPLVTPGDPSRSYLMFKIDATPQGAFCVSCASGCGAPMPEDNVLTTDERHTIRRWIAQGAQDD
jgi:hypothetical protein